MLKFLNIENIEHFITIKFVLLFLLSIFLIAIFSTVYFRPEEFKKSRFSVFLSVLASIAVILFGISLIVSSLAFQSSIQVTKASITKEAIDKLWLYPNQLLANSKNARNEFLGSFYYNNPSLYQSILKKSSQPQTVFTILEEQNIAIVMLQAWEDFMTLRHIDQTGDMVWLNNFIQWAQSPYLKEYFDILKYNYKSTTIELGNLLFEYAKQLPIPTTNAESYHQTIQQLLEDPRLIHLFENTKEN